MASFKPKESVYIDRTKRSTLDLHGYTSGPAIRKLVEFLEKCYEQRITTTTTAQQSNLRNRNIAATTSSATTAAQHEPVLVVVTGTGSHSNNGDGGGPVLKYAVNDFLQRHSFQYTYVKKGGYFVIPILNNTGVLSYQSTTCNVDTKVVVSTSPPTSNDKTFSNHIRKRQNGTSPTTTGLQQQPSLSEIMPTLQEVVYDEKQLERGKTESLEEYRIRQREYNIEQKLYQKAIQVSTDEIRLLDEDENEKLYRAIEVSVMEFSERTYDDDDEEDDDDLNVAILQSLEESDRSTNYDEEKILQLSILESQRIGAGENVENEEELLRRAIQESESMKDASEREEEEEFRCILEQIHRMG